MSKAMILGVLCLAIGLSVAFVAFVNLDDLFAGHLDSWLPRSVVFPLGIAAILTAFGMGSLWQGRRPAVVPKGIR